MTRPETGEPHGRAAREDELERFRQLRQTGDPRLRDDLVADLQGLAIALARRFRGRGIEMDDLVQVAQVGLINAVDRFDPDRGVPFVAFATPTVLGELRRHFRASWAIRVPRGLQETAQRVTAAADGLTVSLGRSPSVAEVANESGLSEQAVLEAMEAATAYSASSLDAQLRGADHDGGLQRHPTTDEEGFGRVEAQQTVERLLPLLSERSRRIVELRYYHDMSQSEIAAVIGMSQMHVSRLLRAAMERLAAELKDND